MCFLSSVVDLDLWRLIGFLSAYLLPLSLGDLSSGLDDPSLERWLDFLTLSLGDLSSGLGPSSGPGDPSLERWLDFGLRWPTSGRGDPSLERLDFAFEWLTFLDLLFMFFLFTLFGCLSFHLLAFGPACLLWFLGLGAFIE